MAEVQDIKRISILDYAQSSGFTVRNIGTNLYSLKEHDSVRIDPQKNCFWRNSNNARGSIIDFVMEFEGKDLRTTLKDLGQIIDNFAPVPVHKVEISKTKKKQKEELILPKKDLDNRRVYAYLNMTRKIDKEIINEMISSNQLYQDTHKNCVFVSYKNNKPIFANIRGTNTGKRFVADVAGNDYNHCFFVDNDKSNMIVTESIIDSLSIMTETKSRGKDPKMFNYLSLSGASKINAVETHIKENSHIKTVIVALDNDEAGRKNAEKIHNLLEQYNINIIDKFPVAGKDWNEQLVLTIEEKEKTTEKKVKTNDVEV